MCWKVWCKGSREPHEPQSKDHVLSVGLPLRISNQTQLEMTGAWPRALLMHTILPYCLGRRTVI